MKRAFLGALLFLILVGEPTVGRASGLFTPVGILVFAVLYISYFLLFDSITHRYKLNNLQLVLINFALYSVLITGLLHGEIRDYALHPHNDVITTLIRVQCSLFPLYVYPLLTRLAPRTKPALQLPAALAVFVSAMAVLSLSGHFGSADLLDTFRVAPRLAAIFVICALAAIFAALRTTKVQKYKPGHAIEAWSWIFLVIGLVPSTRFFLVLLCGMLLTSGFFLAKKSYRHTTYDP